MKHCKRCNRSVKRRTLRRAEAKKNKDNKDNKDNPLIDKQINMYRDIEQEIRAEYEKVYGDPFEIKYDIYTNEEMINKYIKELSFWIKLRKPISINNSFDSLKLEDENIQKEFIREYMLSHGQSEVVKRIQSKFDKETEQYIFKNAIEMANSSKILEE